MQLNLEDKYEFIPEWNGNKDLPDDEQVKVIWKYPSGKMRSAALKIKLVDSDDEKKSEVAFEWDAVVLKCVTEIKNLSNRDKKITQIDELYTYPGLGGLYDEIKAYIITNAKGVEKKT
jgi:hypothetical protein